MSVIRHEIRRGAYADSIVLMQLQSALAALPGVADAGAVMGTEANLELLEANGLFSDELTDARADDLLLVVRADSAEAAAAALGEVDRLMERRSTSAGAAFRPRSLSSAARLLPAAGWVLVSVPGRYAATVAHDALELGKSVFLYSDNVKLEDEVALKREAARRGLLVMGPDCGTALVGGVGLGFANRVRRGPIGIVAASGTGLQAVAAGVHARGSGVSHALGTGGRDLSAEVGGATSLAALDLLARDAATEVIVLVSKPPAPPVASRLLAAARTAGKPVLVWFVGYPHSGRVVEGLEFVSGSSEAAERAVELAAAGSPARRSAAAVESPDGARYLRGLFAGGTLAYEAQQALRSTLAPMFSNAPILEVQPLAEPSTSRAHTILDLGADELTVGRLHPMIDQDLRLRRLEREAADPEVALILLDVVLGYGSHPDPAAELAPAIAEALAGRDDLEIAALVVGTDEDPQGLESQVERLGGAGATVHTDPATAFRHAASRFAVSRSEPATPVAETALDRPAAINVGLESFYDSLVDQEANAVHVEWRPPAGGDARLMALLAKMKG